MRIAAFFQTRVFAILAAGLAVAAIFVLVAGPREARDAGPRLAVPAPAQAEPGAGLPAERIVPLQAKLVPPPARRPAPDADLASVFPPSQLPYVATAQGARVSLACLARNGADLSKPMPSQHRVFAANEEVAARLRAWAQDHGFEVRDPEVVTDHVGAARYRLDLVRMEVPIPEHIEMEGRLVLDAVQKIPGAFYQTWTGEIVR